MPQLVNVWWASRLASDTRIGSAGKLRSREASSTEEVRTTMIAMSSSISPGTACSAASAMASTVPVATPRTASQSICSASASV